MIHGRRTRIHGKARGAGAAARIVIAGALAIVAAACATTAEERPAPPKTPAWHNLADRGLDRGRMAPVGRETDFLSRQEMAFSAALSRKRVATMADAMIGTVLFLGGSPWGRSLEDLHAELARQRIVAEDWPVVGDEPLTSGRISYMICQACDIRGGFWMALFGPSERYCWKEAVYLEFLPPGSVHSRVSGEELLNLFSQADLYLEARRG